MDSAQLTVLAEALDRRFKGEKQRGHRGFGIMELDVLEGEPEKQIVGYGGYGSKVGIGLIMFKMPINYSSRAIQPDIKCTHIFKYDLKCLLLSDILKQLHLIFICLENCIQNDS